MKPLRLSGIAALAGLLAVLGATPGRAASAPGREWIERFTPTRPTLTARYEVAYRFLCFRLARVGTATLRATSGRWRHGVTGRKIPAYLVELTLRTHNYRQSPEKCRVYVNDRLMAVLATPDFNTLVYLKHSDERFNPLFGHDRRTHTLHVYDLEAGRLDFYQRDFLTGAVQTNFTGAVDLASQGEAVRAALQTLAEVFYGRRPPLTARSDFRVHANLDGRAVPLAATTRRADAPLRLLGRRWPSLQVELQPAPEAGPVKWDEFTAWLVPFREVAAAARWEVMDDLAARTPEWSMLPLAADFGLGLGWLRCSLAEISARSNPLPPVKPEPGVAATKGSRP